MGQTYNHGIYETSINGFRLKILHILLLGSINVALFQSIYSYNCHFKSPVKVNLESIINSNTMPITQRRTGAVQDYNHSIHETSINSFRLKILHTLLLGSITVALFKSIYSYNCPFKSPVKVNLGGSINISTITITPAKDRSKAEL